MARLRSTKQKRRTVMTLDVVRAVMAAARSIDPTPGLMLRVTAVSGARRAELAALRWDDLHDGLLTIDSAIEIVSSGDAARDAATKTANTRVITLDPDTVAAIEALRREREPYGPWMFGLGPRAPQPRPHRVVVEADPQARRRRRAMACTTSATGPPPWRSARATTCLPSPAASATPTRQ